MEVIIFDGNDGQPMVTVKGDPMVDTPADVAKVYKEIKRILKEDNPE